MAQAKTTQPQATEVATEPTATTEVDLVKELTELAKTHKLVLPIKGSELDSLKNSVKYQTVESVVIATVEGMKIPLIVRSFTDNEGNYYLSTKPSNTFGNTNEGKEFNSEKFGSYLESVRESEPTTKRSSSFTNEQLIALGNARIEVSTLTNDLLLFVKTKLSVANATIPVVKESSKQVATTLASVDAFSNSFKHKAVNVYLVGTNPLVDMINAQVSNNLLTKEVADTLLANQSKYIYTVEIPKATRTRSSK